MRGVQLVSSFRNTEGKLPGNQANTHTHMPMSWAVAQEWHKDERMRVKERGRKRDRHRQCVRVCAVFVFAHRWSHATWKPEQHYGHLSQGNLFQIYLGLSQDRYDIKSQRRHNVPEIASSGHRIKPCDSWITRDRKVTSCFNTVQLPQPEHGFMRGQCTT